MIYGIIAGICIVVIAIVVVSRLREPGIDKYESTGRKWELPEESCREEVIETGRVEYDVYRTPDGTLHRVVRRIPEINENESI